MSFRLDSGAEVVIGDVVEVTAARGRRKPIYLVDSLFYRETDIPDGGSKDLSPGELKPVLVARCFSCTYTSGRGRQDVGGKLVVNTFNGLDDVEVSTIAQRHPASLQSRVCFQRSTAGRSETAFSRPFPTLGPAGYGLGAPFVWLNIYIDKYVSTDNNSKSTEAVYIEIANADARYKFGDEYVTTVALIPSGCQLFNVWDHVRPQLASLVAGGVTVWDSELGGNTHVGVGIAGLIGDHMQQIVNTGTYGPKGLLNGRACWCQRKDNHLVPTSSCQTHSNARRREQTLVVRKQIELGAQKRRRDLKGGGLSVEAEAHLAEEQKHYGARLVSFDMWLGCGVDPHMQAWWDGGHLLYMGLIKAVVNVLYKGLGSRSKVIFQTRMRDYPWPNGTQAPIHMLKAKFGTGVSMEGWRMVGLGALHCFEGLISQNSHRFFIRLVAVAVRAMGPLTAVGVDELQRECEDLVRDGGGVMGEAWKNKTNVHGLLQLPGHSLAALRNGYFGDTRRHEKRNKESKGLSQGPKSGKGGAGGEENSVRWSVALSSLRCNHFHA